ncbi:hypothetical protein [Fodinicola feengrottensis]|nr:hypothetical protein [Fodinicola feengrottensis]
MVEVAEHFCQLRDVLARKPQPTGYAPEQRQPAVSAEPGDSLAQIVADFDHQDLDPTAREQVSRQLFQLFRSHNRPDLADRIRAQEPRKLEAG